VDTFDPQPHTQLAAVYRGLGRVDAARSVIFDRIDISGRLNARAHRRRSFGGVVVFTIILAATLLAIGTPWPWLLALPPLTAGTLLYSPMAVHWFYKVGFGFGLRSFTALCTFALCLAAGSLGVMAANRGVLELPGIAVGGVKVPPKRLVDFTRLPQVLTQDLTPVQDAIQITAGPEPRMQPATVVMTAGTRMASSLPCGDSINPTLYAADVFIPVLDLRQEAKCSPESSAVGWSLAKSLYAVLGWIVTSLMILTITGLLRERSEK
jgi:hypothetical protein